MTDEKETCVPPVSGGLPRRVRHESLTQRVRAHLKDLHRSRKFSQASVAQALRVDPSAVSHTINRDTRPITLDFLEAVADAARQPGSITISELVAEPGSVLRELSPDEAAILRALRKWPQTVSRALIGFLTFFAEDDDQTRQWRNLREIWRRMNQLQRDKIFGFAVNEAEGTFPLETTAKLFERLSDESRAALETQHKKNRKHRKLPPPTNEP